MAIKINNTVVIDDGRGISGTGLTVTSISASGSVGSAGSVLTSTGSAIYWSNGATVVGVASTTVFTSSGTWTKPPVGKFAQVTIWGGGGCGSRSNTSSSISGGGGGGCVQKLFLMNELPASAIPITIGAGVAGTTSSRPAPPSAPGADNALRAGTTTFGVGLLTAYGGECGTGNGGNGGPAGGIPAGQVHNYPSTPGPSALGGYEMMMFGGAGTNPNANGPFGGIPGFFGGGGGYSYVTSVNPPVNSKNKGGDSYWGGAGGGISTAATPTDPGGPYGGRSINGGDGGLAVNNPSINGAIRGGGGAGISSSNPSPISGAGGDGYCLIQVW